MIDRNVAGSHVLNRFNDDLDALVTGIARRHPVDPLFADLHETACAVDALVHQAQQEPTGSSSWGGRHVSGFSGRSASAVVEKEESTMTRTPWTMMVAIAATLTILQAGVVGDGTRPRSTRPPGEQDPPYAVQPIATPIPESAMAWWMFPIMPEDCHQEPMSFSEYRRIAITERQTVGNRSYVVTGPADAADADNAVANWREHEACRLTRGGDRRYARLETPFFSSIWETPSNRARAGYTDEWRKQAIAQIESTRSWDVRQNSVYVLDMMPTIGMIEPWRYEFERQGLSRRGVVSESTPSSWEADGVVSAFPLLNPEHAMYVSDGRIAISSSMGAFATDPDLGMLSSFGEMAEGNWVIYFFTRVDGQRLLDELLWAPYFPMTATPVAVVDSPRNRP